jgi:hypothetical protein
LTRETYKTINEVKAAFKKFDKNSDGSLSKNELARMMYRWVIKGSFSWDFEKCKLARTEIRELSWRHSLLGRDLNSVEH